MKIFDFTKDQKQEFNRLIAGYFMDNYYSCEKCGCLVGKYNVKTVEETSHGKSQLIGDVGYILGHMTHYYCLVHKPPYSKIKHYPGLDLNSEYYADDVEVDKNGKVI